MSEMKTIEQKYRKLSDIEHCLQRPSMYVGSIKMHTTDMYIPIDCKIRRKEATYNPALLKIFDEIISNSADEHRRNQELNVIDVKVDIQTGKITISDNGGIPVVKHAEYDEWVPEFIFSNLKAGSNFDDTEERLVVGTNGVGSTLTNIFSDTFMIKTSDGKNEFTQTYSRNMMDRTEPVIKKVRGKGYTTISFIPSYSRFELKTLDEMHINLFRKRCIDIAACNPKLTVKFNGDSYNFPKFYNYCQLYVDEMIYEASERWKIGISSSDSGFQQVSFVNGVETKDGGTHVDMVVSQIVEWLREKIRKKHKIDMRPADVRSQFSIFVLAEIVNPSFSSQTKEKLITEQRDFGSTHEITEKMLKMIFESEIVQRILDWAQQKALADERKQLRELNKNIDKSKVLKLIDAKSKIDRHLCTLILTEGDSALGSFRKYRDVNFQGAFPLRGKFLNVTGMSNVDVIQNKEVKEVLIATGLKMGEPPDNMRYGKICIYADADPDGDCIAGLLMNFFGRYWPELFEREIICRVMTPLVVVKKATEKLCFYTHDEFSSWISSTKDAKKWNIEYKKGLAALEDEDFKDIIQKPQMFAILPGKNLKETFNSWFSDDSSLRKEKILKNDEREVAIVKC